MYTLHVHIKASGVKLAIVWGIQLEATDLILEPSNFDYVYFHMVTCTLSCVAMPTFHWIDYALSLFIRFELGGGSFFQISFEVAIVFVASLNQTDLIIHVCTVRTVVDRII